MEEELLLNVSGIDNLENFAVIDEDALLGAGDIHRKLTSDTIDSISHLDSAPVNEQAIRDEDKSVDNEEDGDNQGVDDEEHEEELDYDEDEDDERREKTSRYHSEKRKESGSPTSETNDSTDVNNDRKKSGGVPSLFDKKFSKNPNAPRRPISNQPIPIRLRIEGEPEVVFYPQAFAHLNQNHSIVPRLPNGIPLISMPQNHGRAGFGPSYLEVQQKSTRMVGGGNGIPNTGQWENAVASFLTSNRPSHSHSSSGHRDKYSSRKRSSSHSSYTTSSSYSSRSRSRSHSPKKRRTERDYRKKDDRRERGGYDRPRRNDDRKRVDDSRKRRDPHRSSSERHNQLESVKVLGLSDDYLDKVKEQKRKRDEIVRQKEERRFEKVERKPSASTQQAAPQVSQQANSNLTDRDKKLKAYLAVNVSGLKQLPTAEKKIEGLASSLGPIKKCWRSSDDVVSVIFNEHDKAKDFMLKHNNKVISGLRINVTLEKKYLNLSAMA